MYVDNIYIYTHIFFIYTYINHCRFSANPEEGRQCAALDVEFGGPAMDFMSPEGFSHALFQVLRLKPGGSMTLAPVCSSWVWVNLGL